MNTPKSMVTEISGNPDSESSKDTGGYSIGFVLIRKLIFAILVPKASGAYIFRPNATFPIKSQGQEPTNG
ncbi:hypothetical protein L1887_13635 [Cichorium endivia]|nr:hypothetical protein L1887_13635 [Cichorium endivia]